MKTYYYGRDINSGKIVEFEKPVEGVVGDMCICLNEDGGWHVVKLEDDIKVDDNTFLQITDVVDFCKGASAKEKQMDEYIADMYKCDSCRNFKKVWDKYVKLDN